MDKKYIVVHLNMFSWNNGIYISDEHGNMQFLGDHGIKSLPEIIITLAEQKNLYNVKIVGNQLFAKGLIEEILIQEEKFYGKRKIEIEVI